MAKKLAKNPVKKVAQKKASNKTVKTQKVSVKSVKVPEVKKSFWTKVAEFFGF